MTEKYTGKDVTKIKGLQPVNVLHHDGEGKFKPYFMNCIYFNPMGKSPAGDRVINLIGGIHT